MVADFQTSMKEIREANLGFVSLLTELKRFLSDKGTVEIEVGGTTKVFPTIPSIVEAYRGGEFDEAVIRSGDREIRLKNNNGTLQVLDGNGRVAPLDVAQLRFSSIASSSFDTIDVKRCTIDALDAREVLTEEASFQKLSVEDFKATYGIYGSLATGSLQAGKASINSLAVQSFVYRPTSVANVFADAGGPYNYSQGNAVFVARNGASTYVCRDLTAAERAAYPDRKDPSTMGFTPLPTEVSARLSQAPDMTTFQGDTRCASYQSGGAAQILNCCVMGTSPSGTQPIGTTSSVRTGWGDSDGYASFSSILGWPIRSYVKQEEWLPQALRIDGAVFLHEFCASDIGRIIHIRTFGEPWTIARRLTVKYSGNIPQKGVLDLGYEVPPYTCLRLRMARYGAAGDDGVYYYNVLELA